MGHPDGSVSGWIDRLKFGESEAAENIWRRYASQLVAYARGRIGNAPKRAVDEEDIAQSVFGSICRGAAAGRFDDIKNRDELWWLLMAITKQKVVSRIRHETAKKRGGGRIVSESDLAKNEGFDESTALSLDQLACIQPTPDFLVMFAEQHSRLLNLLDDNRLQTIASRRIEGYSVLEIASELNLTVRSVERKLRLIRSKWASDLSNMA